MLYQIKDGTVSVGGELILSHINSWKGKDCSGWKKWGGQDNPA